MRFRRGRYAQCHAARVGVRPARRLDGEVRIIDVNEAQCAAIAGIGGTQACAGQAGPLRAEANDDFAGHVGHGVLAAVAAKGQSGFELVRQIVRRRNGDLLQKYQRDFRAARAAQTKARAFRHNGNLMHRHGLKVAAALACGLEPRRFEAAGDVFGSALIGR